VPDCQVIIKGRKRHKKQITAIHFGPYGGFAQKVGNASAKGAEYESQGQA
jgi:hypothetical protein